MSSNRDWIQKDIIQFKKCNFWQNKTEIEFSKAALKIHPFKP